MKRALLVMLLSGCGAAPVQPPWAGRYLGVVHEAYSCLDFGGSFQDRVLDWTVTQDGAALEVAVGVPCITFRGTADDDVTATLEGVRCLPQYLGGQQLNRFSLLAAGLARLPDGTLDVSFQELDEGTIGFARDLTERRYYCNGEAHGLLVKQEER